MFLQVGTLCRFNVMTTGIYKQPLSICLLYHFAGTKMIRLRILAICLSGISDEIFGVGATENTNVVKYPLQINAITALFN